jgi:hypothetical protein
VGGEILRGRREDEHGNRTCRADESTDERLPAGERRPGSAYIEHRHDGARLRLITA